LLFGSRKDLFTCHGKPFPDIFQTLLGWNKARVKFFVSFMFVLCKVQSVYFTKLAQGFEDKAKVESNMRRIQRFFAKDENLMAG
jgi:hypothetical protein